MLKKIKLTLFGLALVFGAQMISAQTWTDPTTTPSGDNMEVPVNATGVSQTKQGGLSVGAFIAAQDAQFDQQLFLNGMVRGSDPTDLSADSTVLFGGNGKTVSGSVTGNLSADTFIQMTTLGGAAATPLCADEMGNIIAC